MSIGALKMPAIAEAVPDSARRRAICGPNAVKYCSMAMPPLIRATLLSALAGSPGARMQVETRGSQTFSRNPVGSSINWSYSSAPHEGSAPTGGSRYWKPVPAGMSMPGMP